MGGKVNHYCAPSLLYILDFLVNVSEATPLSGLLEEKVENHAREISLHRNLSCKSLSKTQQLNFEIWQISVVPISIGYKVEQTDFSHRSLCNN